jgi:hypothetical protein
MRSDALVGLARLTNSRLIRLVELKRDLLNVLKYVNFLHNQREKMGEKVPERRYLHSIWIQRELEEWLVSVWDGALDRLHNVMLPHTQLLADVTGSALYAHLNVTFRKHMPANLLERVRARATFKEWNRAVRLQEPEETRQQREAVVRT